MCPHNNNGNFIFVDDRFIYCAFPIRVFGNHPNAHDTKRNLRI
nr:MAG TPA: hypothetical protein [Caudoviricetes sp.]